LDWFIDSVNEETYASSKAHCNSLKILDTLNFAQIIKLYALTCFAKYPQFQLRALGQKDATLTNNSTSFDKRGRKGKGKNDHGKGKGRGSLSQTESLLSNQQLDYHIHIAETAPSQNRKYE
jgi:hypothetical protein